MSNPYNNLDTRLIELVLKYDDPDPKERKAMEQYLNTQKQLAKTKPFFKPNTKLGKKIVRSKQPMQIDISLPTELTNLLKEGK
jgi:hypothetical protein|tara:strand:- start:338 stop:586 length:249 start_codon:yes stop_codon:yes gene_type:complete